MMRFTSCPKCGHGDLMLDQDVYGWYTDCLQCGHLADLKIAKATTNSDHLQADVSEHAA